MKSTARSIPTAPFALAAALLAAFLVLFAPLNASAHDALLASSPEADATVETLPAELTLTFSAKLIDGEGATEVVVTDAAGVSVTDGSATVNGAIVTQPLAAEAEAGEYHVVWKVVSSDGHPISGEYMFTVATGTAAQPAPETSETPAATPTAVPSEAPEDPNMTAQFSISPFWMIAAAVLILVLGTVLILLFSRRGNRKRAESDTPAGR